MNQQRVYRTEGIVLRGYNYGEADRILTLFTPQAGKVRAIAKGVRRTKSRKSGHLDLFTRSAMLLARGRQLDVVTQAETIESFRPARDDLWRSSWCHYVAELVDGFTAEQLPNYPLYSLAVATFRRLAQGAQVDMVVHAFEMQLLGATGYRPQLFRCLNCDNAIQAEANRFSPTMGGVLCPNCASADHAASPISVNALKVLRHLQTDEEAMLHLPALPEDVRQEVARRLQEYITYRLESRPRSLAFLDRLRFENASLI